MRLPFTNSDRACLQKAVVVFLSLWYVLLSSHLFAFLFSASVESLQPIATSERVAQSEEVADHRTRPPLTHEDHSSSGSFFCMMCDLDILFTTAFELPTDSVPSIRNMNVQLLYRMNLSDYLLPERLVPNSLLKIPILHG